MRRRKALPKGGWKKVYATVVRTYPQGTIKKRIEALFLDNIGKVITREQILQVARDPSTGEEPENWHQRLSELRTDDGYTILSARDRQGLEVEEYLMPSSDRRPGAAKRIKPNPSTWAQVLRRAGQSCEWDEGSESCRLKEGERDPIGGGRVKLTPDHMSPHSMGACVDPADVTHWRALCGRHQVMKKNYWDNTTGRLNLPAIVQAASKQEKFQILLFLLEYFGYEYQEDGSITT